MVLKGHKQKKFVVLVKMKHYYHHQIGFCLFQLFFICTTFIKLGIFFKDPKKNFYLCKVVKRKIIIMEKKSENLHKNKNEKKLNEK